MKEPFTKIKFTKTLTEAASGDHPALLYAKEGETGIIGAGSSPEGYWAKVDGQPDWFGVREEEFEIIEK